MKAALLKNSAILFSMFMIMSAGMSLSSCATRSQAGNREPSSEAFKTLPKTHLAAVDYAYQRMIDAGISKSFAHRIKKIYLRQNDAATGRDKIISLNVFGFLAHADYSLHYSKTAVKKTRAFVHKYRKTLALAQKRYHVSKETIAALLWVETKFGKYTGTFNLPYVYFSLLQADHPAVAKLTLDELSDRQPAAVQSNPQYTREYLEQKVIERSVQKASWALDQLKAIQHLNRAEQRRLFSTHASYAGAFGYPQFIPTTFADYAVSCNRNAPDLFNMRDAILSVAHYLHEKGWKENSASAKSDALFEYNRSRDYGAVILKIADEVRPHRAKAVKTSSRS